MGFNHKQFSKASDVPYATVHEFFNCEKNVTLMNFEKLIKPLGLDLHEIFEDQINHLLGKSVKKSQAQAQDSEDLTFLINGLDKYQRKELIATAVHLNKIKKNTKIIDVIERIEKKYLNQ